MSIHPILQRILDTVDATRRGRIGSIDLTERADNIPVLGGAMAAAGVYPAAIANTASLGFEGAQDIGKLLLGGMMLASGKAREVNPLTPFAEEHLPAWLRNNVSRQALDDWRARSDLDPLQRLFQAHEAGASGNEMLTGPGDAALDPTNLADVVGLIGHAPGAARAVGRLTRDILTDDGARNILGLGAKVAPEATRALAAPAATAAESRVPSILGELVDNAPAAPPSLGSGERLLLGPGETPPVPDLPMTLAGQRIIPGEPVAGGKLTDLLAETGAARTARPADADSLNAAMKPLLVAEGAKDWADLTPQEVGSLVKVAYGDDAAVTAARARYTDPAELASRAFDRISGVATNEAGDIVSKGGSTATLADFARQFPELARKVANLPPHGEMLAADNALQATEAELEAIRNSPFYSVFSKFNEAGDFRNHPVTGKRFHRPRDLESIFGNGEGFDELAQEALDPFGGYNPKHAESADDFWWQARDQFKRYRELTKKAVGDELGYTPEGTFVGVPKGAKPKLVPEGPKDLIAEAGDLGAGDIAAGGFGITPPKPNRLGALLSGTALGGLGGGALGDKEDPEDQRNTAAFGAIFGALVGIGATSKAGRAVVALTPFLWKAGLKAQKEAFATGRNSIGLGDIARVWSAQTTHTLRNIFQDELISRLWLADAGVRQKVMNENWQSMVDLFQQGHTDGFFAMPERSQDILTKLGLAPQVGPLPGGKTLATVAGGAGTLPKLGTSMVEQQGAELVRANERLGKALSPFASAGIQAGLSVASPLNAVPGLGVAAGAVRGFTAPFWNEIFGAVNQFTHAAARHAVWQESVVDDLGREAAAFGSKHGLGGFPGDGLISAEEVKNLTGNQGLADEWSQVIEAAVGRGEARAKQVFGDFSNQKWWEKGLGKVVPFSSWALRAYPRTVQMLAHHPGVTLAILGYMERDRQRAEAEGRPGYQVGTIPFGNKTPVLGKVLEGMTGGKEGTLRLNILGALTPFSGEMFASDDQNQEPATGMAGVYQGAKGAIQKTGFSFNPFIVGLAYALDWDYQRPGALSRTAGVEQALPGPEVPSFAHGPLDFLRRANGGSVSETQPVDRQLGQDVYDQTGYALNSPQNAGLNLALFDPDHPQAAQAQALSQQAEGEVDRAGTAKNLWSLLMPVSATASSDTADYARVSANYQRDQRAQAAEAEQAQGIDPVMRQALDDSLRKNNPLLALLIDEQRRSMEGEGANIGRGVDKQSRAYDALAEWRRQNGMVKYMTPSLYYAQEAQVKKALGIPDAP